MKEALKELWRKPIRTIFMLSGIGWVITKIVKAVKK